MPRQDWYDLGYLTTWSTGSNWILDNRWTGATTSSLTYTWTNWITDERNQWNDYMIRNVLVRDVVAADLRAAEEVDDVPGHVRMREHDGLGPSGGAGRVR